MNYDDSHPSDQQLLLALRENSLRTKRRRLGCISTCAGNVARAGRRSRMQLPISSAPTSRNSMVKLPPARRAASLAQGPACSDIRGGAPFRLVRPRAPIRFGVGRRRMCACGVWRVALPGSDWPSGPAVPAARRCFDSQSKAHSRRGDSFQPTSSVRACEYQEQVSSRRDATKSTRRIRNRRARNREPMRSTIW